MRFHASLARMLVMALLALATLAPATSFAQNARERAVLTALADYERAVLAGDTVTLKRIWADDYTFVNARGVLVTRAQRLANFRTGATDVVNATNKRQVTVQVFGDVAVLRQLFTLHGRYSGKETNTDVWCTFVWVWRGGRWRMATNQLTAVAS
jgi:ketosteroid isomerase-like protein